MLSPDYARSRDSKYQDNVDTSKAVETHSVRETIVFRVYGAPQDSADVGRTVVHTSHDAAHSQIRFVWLLPGLKRLTPGILAHLGSASTRLPRRHVHTCASRSSSTSAHQVSHREAALLGRRRTAR